MGSVVAKANLSLLSVAAGFQPVSLCLLSTEPESCSAHPAHRSLERRLLQNSAGQVHLGAAGLAPVMGARRRVDELQLIVGRRACLLGRLRKRAAYRASCSD